MILGVVLDYRLKKKSSDAEFQLFMLEGSRFISTQQNFERHLSSYNRLQPRIPLPAKPSSRASAGYTHIRTHTHTHKWRFRVRLSSR